MEHLMETNSTICDSNMTKFIEDSIGIRDLPTNGPIIEKLDEYLKSVCLIHQILSLINIIKISSNFILNKKKLFKMDCNKF